MKPAGISRRALLGTGAAAALMQALPAVAQSPAKPLVLARRWASPAGARR